MPVQAERPATWPTECRQFATAKVAHVSKRVNSLTKWKSSTSSTSPSGKTKRLLIERTTQVKTSNWRWSAKGALLNYVAGKATCVVCVSKVNIWCAAGVPLLCLQSNIVALSIDPHLLRNSIWASPGLTRLVRHIVLWKINLSLPDIAPELDLNTF